MQRLVFLDETGLNTKMTRLYGRAPIGERCYASAPFGHWQTVTFIAALRHDRVCAPWLIDGPMDGTLFLTYLEKVLSPELRRGDLVICDNLSSHKVQGVREAIAARGARLRYLPAYSPDLNPIEMTFAKLKADLRRAAARDLESLLQATSTSLGTFTPEHCSNFFRHARYATN